MIEYLKALLARDLVYASVVFFIAMAGCFLVMVPAIRNRLLWLRMRCSSKNRGYVVMAGRCYVNHTSDHYDPHRRFSRTLIPEQVVAWETAMRWLRDAPGVTDIIPTYPLQDTAPKAGDLVINRRRHTEAYVVLVDSPDVILVDIRSGKVAKDWLYECMDEPDETTRKRFYADWRPVHRAPRWMRRFAESVYIRENTIVGQDQITRVHETLFPKED